VAASTGFLVGDYVNIDTGVFQITGPAGVFLEEEEIARQLQPPPAPAKKLRPPDEPPPDAIP